MTSDPMVTRFAPSPTGYLHLGHVRSALEGWRAARGAGGRFLLRLEDIDQTRCRGEYAAAIIEDLLWLGLSWDAPVRRQSEHFDDYRRALDRVEAMAVLYPCFCTRREIRDEIARTVVCRTRNQAPPIRGRAAGSARDSGPRSSALGSIMRCGSTSLVRSL
jgi:glutamyl-Q tRNA(Asp) synthetase